MDIDQHYLMTCKSIIDKVVPENPKYKDLVSFYLDDYIYKIVGPKAPKVTAMIIDLPIEDIKLMMQDWSLFNTRIQEAC